MRNAFLTALLIGCAVAPVAGFFPVEIHYGLMKGGELFGFSENAETVSAGPPGISYRALVFFQDWLSLVMALVFFAGVCVLGYRVRRNEKPRPSGLVLLLFFGGAASYFFIPHLAPFFFAVVMLAVLANIRIWWVDGRKGFAEQVLS
ncbi:MAG: hypothetical protein CMO55_14710 [Verrucomicrobiales bacterium]|nr:hypothetical protein [Verrucomicrobiales bacterium]